MDTEERLAAGTAVRFSIEMTVRDYECDLQGVVNNANYLHYLEHTRHEYLAGLGESFARLHEEGVDLFVTRVDIRDRQSLRAGERFRSLLTPCREGTRLVFHQTIRRMSDNEACAEATVECVAVVNGRLSRGEIFDRML
jgi:acyl-CoA thioester hydrolase